MPTTREVVAKKAQRLQRGRRYYTADRLGPQCADSRCHLKLDARLAELGEHTHPTCSKHARYLLNLDRTYRLAPTANVSPTDDTTTSPADDTTTCG